VFEPDKTRLDPRFLHHLLRSQPYRDQYDLFVRANTTFDRRIQQEDLDQLPLLLPKVVEQRRIADFLDDRVTRIDQIIRARQRQSRLLHWALASEVAGLVASGGEGWLTGSLRRFAKSCDSLRVPLSSEERATRQGKYPYYGASGVIDHVDDYLFDGPKVLVSEDGANLLLRSTAIAFVADGQYWVNNHAHILEPFDGAHDFWAARIEALDVSAWVTGSAQPKLTIDATMALPVSAPAQVEARVALGKQAVDARTAVEKRTWALEKSCTLMFEYKKSLITAAVTGELDVTTAGSGIPG
jgi:type I restriction enzyme S subunit